MDLASLIIINCICVAILLLIYINVRNFEPGSLGRYLYCGIIVTTIVLCVSDVFSQALVGQNGSLVQVLLHLTNGIYFECSVLIGYLWLIYVLIKIYGGEKVTKKVCLLAALPLILFTVSLLLNSFTQMYFVINEANVYHRGQFVFVHWIVDWGYLVAATCFTAHAVRKEKNRLKKEQYVALLSFIIAPAVASVPQMLFYGVSSTQVGITFSLLMFFVSISNSQVITDPLTGLNNRRGLQKYILAQLGRHSDAKMMVIMIDLNNFKKINDSLGHVVGDEALIKTADALRIGCNHAKERLFLCRFGGDEFVIASTEPQEEDNEKLVEAIRQSVNRTVLYRDKTFTIEISIGQASGPFDSLEDAGHLLLQADMRMYEDKKRQSLV